MTQIFDPLNVSLSAVVCTSKPQAGILARNLHDKRAACVT